MFVGIHHTALSTADLDRLRALGMKFQSELVEQTPEVANCYGRDPDGNLIELIEFK